MAEKVFSGNSAVTLKNNSYAVLRRFKTRPGFYSGSKDAPVQYQGGSYDHQSQPQRDVR